MALLPVDDAIARLLAAADARRATLVQTPEWLPLVEAAGRVLAEDIHATLAVPPEDNSAMDGYALCLADLDLALRDGLPVSQRIPAGTAPQPLQPGTLARLFTGAVIPPGADAVVMQENTEVVDGRIRLTEPLRAGENIRRAGEDVAAGAQVVAAGTRLGPAHIGLLAGTGHARVPVWPRLRAALLCTGDELVPPGQPLASGQIPNSNQSLLQALLASLGIDVIVLDEVPDTLEATRAALRRARAAGVDVILSTGGVSVGEEDHVRAAVLAEGRLDLWKLALKPGKPLAFGAVDDIPFLGLPGNPQSVWVTFQVVATPFLKRLAGESAVMPRLMPLPVAFSRTQPQSRREYLRVQVQLIDGRATAVPHPHQGSGALSSAAWADALAVIEAGRIVTADDCVPCLIL